MPTDPPPVAERPVLAGVNGSDTATALVDFAAVEAARYDAPLTLVHVWPGRYTGAFRGRSAMPSPADAQRLLSLAAARACLAVPGLRVRNRLLDGGAGALLEEASAGARLLIVGHRDQPDARSAWGSTTAYLAYRSACPLLIRRGPARDAGPVVVAVSLRRTGDETLAFAFERAALVGCPLSVVHMWTTSRADAEQSLGEALRDAAARFPAVPVEPLVVSASEMPRTIEQSLRRGRLMVAGTGRGGSFAELLCNARDPHLGTPATCPTVLVPQVGPKDPGGPGPATRR
ncbi:universal stress protein [Actinoplanes sp. LDG1-06]|uniref:Universal stress protein n=1 Tax=Paractinoplanes ovalisporus TaxID=2810368 RepID=A0ABS2A965_9ACTN|nr:universal stress protein [Actinoplanes ovalisporus]MBM2616362.1 universal stress protein [Actinoplanes ovalisporus]